MKLKNIMLITIIVVILISLGTVNASQNNLTDDSNNETTIRYSNTGTFSDLNNLIENSSDNSEITLKKDYTYDNTVDSNFSSGIHINKSLTINGQGHIIDANTKAKIFKIHSKVILKNINFVNAYGNIENNYYSVGVAVDCLNSTDIINCSFKNNYVGGFGSAIYFETYGNIINCSFFNNSATREGGAVYFENNGCICNSVFINNTGLAGGAIHSNNCKIINSTFLNNSAYYGGVIYTNNAEIINSTFKDNYATLSGGSIYTNNANIIYSNFINSSAQDAGAINLQWGNSDVIDCNFTNCRAKNTGGAIVFTDYTYQLFSSDEYAAYEYKCNIINCSFLNNNAKSCGAVKFEGSGEIIASRFINNTCKSNGGAVNFRYIEDKRPHIIIGDSNASKTTKHNILNCSFINNNAALGGGIYCEYGNIINCSFLNNTANIGDGVYLKDNKSKLINSEINGLVYEFDIEHCETSQITPRLTIIANNTYATHSADDIVEIKFKSNTATIKLWVEIPGLLQKTNLTADNFKTSILLTNLTKSENYTILCGFNEGKNDNTLSPVVLGYNDILGAVDKKTVEIKFNKNIKSKGNCFNDLQMLINDCNSSELNLKNDYIYDNTVDSDFNNGVNIYQSLIINGNNHIVDAKKSARIFTITADKVILKNIYFINGNSTRGSAISANNNNITLINCSFINNNALDSGGALSLKTVVSSIINCSFINNHGRWYGGAVSSTSSGNSHVINSVFINNTSDYSDGAIGSNNCNIINSTFTGNRADYYAGAVNLGDGNIINSIFINNYARICGGAVYTSYWSDNNIINSTFINNSADAEGGAIASNVHTKSHIINCNFINNYAKIEGGAISISENENVIIISCNFKNNNAKNGRAIYSNDCRVIVVTSIFAKEKDMEVSGNLTLINCHFNNEKMKSKVKICLTSKKTFKSKNKHKKYTIALKSDKKPVKKVKVTLKINRKTFKAKTNNKGKATFKIPLTKKGKYIGTITFKGNENYRKTIKKVKLIIK